MNQEPIFGSADDRMQRDLTRHLHLDREVQELRERLEALETRARAALASGTVEAARSVENALRFRIAMEDLIIEILTDFVSQGVGETDRGINSALKKLGHFTGVDRSYFFVSSPDLMWVQNTHEWCAEGVTPEIANLQQVRLEDIPWAMQMLFDKEILHIPSVASLPPEAALDREFFEAQSIKSLICIPVLSGESVAGFIGFDAVKAEKRWNDEDITLLCLVGEIILNAMRQRDAEEALRASESRNSALLDAIPDLMFVQTADCTYVDVHASDPSLLYVPQDQIIGRKSQDLLPAHITGLIQTAITEVLKSGKTQLIEYQLAIEGDNKYFEARLTPCGQDTVMSLVREITDRKRTELALRNVSEAVSARAGVAFFQSLAQKLAESLDADYAFIARPTNPDQVVLRTIGMWGPDGAIAPKEYNIQDTPCERVYADRMCVIPRGVAAEYPRDKFLQDGRIESYISTILADSRGAAIGHVAVMYRQPQKKVDLAVSVLRVFAGRAAGELERMAAEEERARLESQMQHSQKLESLGVLAGGIAHDFNNLLSGVLGNASLALMELPPGSAARPIVEQMEEAALRMSDLTRQMLAYSGRGRFVIREVDLNETITRMIQLLRVSISKKAELKLHLHGEPVLIDADVTQANQVLMNLITNASDSLGDRSGTISIRTSIITASSEDFLDMPWSAEMTAGRYAVLEVSDTGCGMDDETRRRVFDPFFSTKFAGRGLGLASVLGIVRGHKGAIRVVSRLGFGSTFRVYYRAAEMKMTPTISQTPGAERWTGNGTILVADDEESVRKVTQRMLERLGFQVLLASDGPAAIDQYSRHRQEIVAVILDMTMPRMDGNQVFDTLRGMNPDIKVVLMSGYDETEATQKFDGSGPAGFLAKPFRAQDLANRLREILGKQA